ncbi:MAG: tRNA (uridine(34)/cytosine(34)/5-carboxymethylaminomethyluridine(34)-2'-O)-methyltransferase TrmL [Candidatus Aminicenantes bacterium]|nr:MAG: tRNA (uridine(34)/cytosine(34)/5-carboxymethylaminomethyluridine(34)-2'-O)-methyltransferase TrmL [Candidatus Aminicenantes bacterium]
MLKTKERQCNAEVVLVEPEIPQNTGNIARTCAALGCPLHLIEPLGFSLDDKYLKRAGLDYWHLVEIKCYPNIEAFFEKHRNGGFFFLTKKVLRSFYEADLQTREKMYFFFGKETYGLPDTLIAQYPDNCFRIPMRCEARSLNLSNVVAVVLYEAFRQNGFPGLR